MEHDDTNYNPKGSAQWSPLHMAAATGNMKRLVLLLDSLDHPNLSVDLITESIPTASKDYRVLKLEQVAASGDRAFHVALRHGQVLAARELIKAGCDVLSKGKGGQTAAHICAIMDLDREFEMLWKNNKLNPYAVTDDGDTIVHLAASHGHTLFLAFLASKSILTEKFFILKNKLGHTCLHSAARGGNIDTVQWVLNYIESLATNHIEYIRSKQPGKEMLPMQLWEYFFAPASNGKGPAQIATLEGNLAVANFLDAYKKKMMTARAECKEFFSAIKEQNIESVKYHIKKHGSSIVTEPHFKNGFTAVLEAVKVNNPKMLDLLMKEVDDCNNASNPLSGDTLSHVAVREKAADSLRYLLQHKLFDINATNKAAITPKELALTRSSDEILEILKDYLPVPQPQKSQPASPPSTDRLSPKASTPPQRSRAMAKKKVSGRRMPLSMASAGRNVRTALSLDEATLPATSMLAMAALAPATPMLAMAAPVPAPVPSIPMSAPPPVPAPSSTPACAPPPPPSPVSKPKPIIRAIELDDEECEEQCDLDTDDGIMNSFSEFLDDASEGGMSIGSITLATNLVPMPSARRDEAVVLDVTYDPLDRHLSRHEIGHLAQCLREHHCYTTIRLLFTTHRELQKWGFDARDRQKLLEAIDELKGQQDIEDGEEMTFDFEDSDPLMLRRTGDWYICSCREWRTLPFADRAARTCTHLKKLRGEERELRRTDRFKTRDSRMSMMKAEFYNAKLKHRKTEDDVSSSIPSHQQLCREDFEYIQEQEIGRGSFGIVRAAYWRNTLVAVKYLNNNISNNGKWADTLLHEAVLMSRVSNHPNIVPFVGVILEKSPAIVTHFMRGGSVYDLLFPQEGQKPKLIPLVQRIEMALGATKGIIHLHKSKIIHRDIAARNLLLDEKYNIYVADFSLSRFLETNSENGFTEEAFGPIRWMAPEAMKLKQFSEKSDVYSFGVTLMEILQEHRPWADIQSLDVVCRLVCEGKRERLHDRFDTELRDLVHACMEQECLDRPSMEDVHKVLDTYHRKLCAPPGNNDHGARNGKIPVGEVEYDDFDS